jgi:hypothetical protein
MVNNKGERKMSILTKRFEGPHLFVGSLASLVLMVAIPVMIVNHNEERLELDSYHVTTGPVLTSEQAYKGSCAQARDLILFLRKNFGYADVTYEIIAANRCKND